MTCVQILASGNRQGCNQHMPKRSRSKLPKVEASEALKERVMEIYPLASYMKAFYDRHLHRVRKTAARLSRETKEALEEIEKTDLPAPVRRGNKKVGTGPVSKAALRRLLQALDEFENDGNVSLLTNYGGADSLSGRRANHVPLWVAGVLQGEAESGYGRDVRLPWTQIEKWLKDCGSPAREYEDLGKDVTRNRQRPWFMQARESGLASKADWPDSTPLR